MFHTPDVILNLKVSVYIFYDIINLDFSHRHALCKTAQGVLAETCCSKGFYHKKNRYD